MLVRRLASSSLTPAAKYASSAAPTLANGSTANAGPDDGMGIALPDSEPVAARRSSAIPIATLMPATRNTAATQGRRHMGRSTTTSGISTAGVAAAPNACANAVVLWNRSRTSWAIARASTPTTTGDNPGQWALARGGGSTSG